MRKQPPAQQPAADRESATDAELLARFAGRSDEAAFRQLVERHGPLVLGVCRRLLGDRHDAEDAFQATFLVLARSAGRIRQPAALAGWLHAVACRTARRLRKRRRTIEEPILCEPIIDSDPLLEITRRHARQQLDEELGSMPARHRLPLVLKYFEGKTAQQIAGELSLSVSAVEGRLRRGKRLLRVRLARRGVTPAAVLAALLAAEGFARAEVAAALSSSAAKQGAAYAAGKLAAGQLQSMSVQLAKQELAIMSAAAVKSVLSFTGIAAAVLTAMVAGWGALEWSGVLGSAASPILVASAAEPGASAEAAAAVKLDPPATDPFSDAPAPMPGDRPRPPKADDPAMKKYLTMDYKRSSIAEERIHEALDEPTDLEFIETPLVDAMEYLGDLHGIKVLFDARALDGAGIGSDTPITNTLKRLPLRDALPLMLADLDLDYTVKHGVLMITTKEVAARTMEIRVLEIRHLPEYKPEEIVKVIREVIRPETWRAEGVANDDRPASIAVLGDALIVTQSQHAQEEIIELLQQLARHIDNPLYEAE